MELKEKHCWREIDVDAVKSNYELIKKISDKPFYTVVKANAYGHGAKYMAKIYQELDTFGFCVSSFDEAMELRHSGVTRPILILGYTDPGKAHELFVNNLTQVIISLDYATRLNDAALYPVDCHVKLDTGMGRLGFDLVGNKEESFSQIRKLLDLHNLKISGMFTHFPAADSLGEKELAYTRQRIDLFNECAEMMEKRGFSLKLLHAQNSAGIARKLKGDFTAMRAGIILYGRQPSDEVILPGLRPTISLKAVVTHVKTVPAGRYIGYGMNYRSERPTKIATVCAGYADGVMRNLSRNGHRVMINGEYYPITGNVCMDQLMVDITGSDIKVGDEVTVIGGSGECGYTRTAKRASTIEHELMCNISKRVPRVYVEGGKPVHIEYGIL